MMMMNMKKMLRTVPPIEASALLLVLVLAAVSPATLAQEAKKGDAPPPPAPEGLMQEYLKLSQPGEHHKYLDKMAGSWTYTVKLWSPMGGEPTESVGTIDAAWILGGRFLKSDFTGTLMNMPFQGISYDGYDNLQKRYVTTWIDNFTTGIQVFEGGPSTDGKVRTMTTEGIDPLTGQKMKTKGVTTILSADSYTYDAYVVLPDGKEFKQMELVAKRRS